MLTRNLGTNLRPDSDAAAAAPFNHEQSNPALLAITRRVVISVLRYRVPIQLAKKPLEKSLEKPLENPLEISYTGKTPKMGSLDMSQNQIWISSGFSSGFLAN